MQKIYRLHFPGSGRLKLSRFRLSGDDEEFTKSTPTEVELEEGDSTVVEILSYNDEKNYSCRGYTNC